MGKTLTLHLNFQNMDALQQIRQPICAEMEQYKQVFDSYLVHSNPILREVLAWISQRKGKMMRPMLTILTAKMLCEEVPENSIYAAATFEFFHTASLVHDDIVDESDERRGQKSINNAYGNQVAVLVGDFLLANSLLCAAKTGSSRLIEIVSNAAQNLASGELLQLDNVRNNIITEDIYFDIIRNKTAALFSACTEGGAMMVSSDKTTLETLKTIGEYIGICFQIRDDIFDYDNTLSIGKPTGNDMKEGKLTLPVIHALLTTKNEEMLTLAHHVKDGTATQDMIDTLVSFTKQNGGIDYAIEVMNTYAEKAKKLLDAFPSSASKQSLIAYIDYVVSRNI